MHELLRSIVATKKIDNQKNSQTMVGMFERIYRQISPSRQDDSNDIDFNK